MAPRIRDFRWPADTNAVLSFQYEVYETNFPGFKVTDRFLRDYANELRAAARNPYEKLYVLDDGGRVCGFLWLEVRATMVDPVVGYVKNIYVAPELRGQGYGRLLLKAADEWFKLMGCRKATLDVSVCNERALKVYEAAGYKPARYRMEKSLE
ncbi:MAG: GNAT family N-acetyltransferase [Armatimonadetes bacterium]|nr:GNAT family N-acetyltransferase [Armatimonadota bacterium]